MYAYYYVLIIHGYNYYVATQVYLIAFEGTMIIIALDNNTCMLSQQIKIFTLRNWG